jgi:ATP synthase A1 C subunit
MPDFAYINARIHAMRSRLFPRPDLEAMAGLETLADLWERLLTTGYQEALSAAAAQRGQDLAGLLTGLNDYLHRTARTIIRMGGAELRGVVEAPFEEWHLRTVLALLRGIHGGRAAEDLRQDVIPVVRLGRRLVGELAEQKTVADLINLLVTVNDPYGRALTRVQDQYDPKGSLVPLEQTLVEFYFHRCLEREIEDDESRASLRQRVVLEIDFQNVLLVLKGVFWNEDRERIREALIPRGSINPGVLEAMLQAEKIDAAVQNLAGTVFQGALQNGLGETAAKGDIAAVEKKLDRVVVQRSAAMLHKDPLSISSVIGYVALLDVEVKNLRMIAVGIDNDLPRDRIVEEMVFV